MITQIIIKEDRDLGISNNWGLPEPFQSAVKAQMFIFSPFEFMQHIIIKWNNVPRFNFRALDAHTIAMIQEFDKLKNKF